MVRLFLVDSGTTNTRLRVVENGIVTESHTAQAGAAKGTAAVREALSRLLHEVSQLPAEAVIFSGMITSPTGLMEIPHIPGPVDLSRPVPQRHDFPELSPLPFYFIPGVKFVSDSPEGGDIIRGEETELAGYLARHGADKRRIFLHLGSHHKAMTVEGGALTHSATAMTGEMLSAVAGHTLLSSSLELSDDLELSWALRGMELASREGLARALFAVRLMDVRDHLPMTARMSWALGALAWEDIMMLRPHLDPLPDELVLYGRENFARVIEAYLKEHYPQLPVTVLSHADSEMLSPAGAQLAWNQIKE